MLLLRQGEAEAEETMPEAALQKAEAVVEGEAAGQDPTDPKGAAAEQAARAARSRAISGLRVAHALLVRTATTLTLLNRRVAESGLLRLGAVSYTHLTLPTILRV